MPKIQEKHGKATKTGNAVPAKAVALLKRYTTARKIAREVGVSKVHAYRILELIGEQRTLQMKLIREKPTGPLAKAYRFKRS